MGYIDGFVLAVPTDRKADYIDHANQAAPMFVDLGSTRLVEAWGIDVPIGKQNDLHMAVQAEPGETIVFSWLEWPDRQTRDAGGEAMRAMPGAEDMMATMPFDGSRMIMGGFAIIADTGPVSGTGFIDGMIMPVPLTHRDAYTALAHRQAEALLAHGALRVVSAWGDDVQDGKRTDFRRATLAKPDEAVVFSWVEWPSQAAHDAGWPGATADARMQGDAAVQDGHRMAFGGFEMVVDSQP
ncbi:DUF1428 domain-containing protein [Polymorphobacter sp.]|uniref:DUF1428 domain-containing protein n=1 Tax=Polymorphobacter sp. TaxID=1909290 RepID=UPI003F6E5597